MRAALMVCAIAIAGGAVAQRRQVPEGTWVITTRAGHAGCIEQAVPRFASTVSVEGDTAVVELVVEHATVHRACELVDALLAHGIDEVIVDRRPVRLVELCGPSDDEAARRWALRRLEDEARRLHERLEAVVVADERGSIDAADARRMADGCREAIAGVVGVATPYVTAEVARSHVLRPAPGATLADMERVMCARVRDAATRIGERAGTHAALEPARRAIFLTSPDGWYVPGRRERTLDARTLRRARVWIRVENAIFDNLVDGDCPIDTPAVTRYTRHAFDRRGRLLATRVRTVCADFSAAELR